MLLDEARERPFSGEVLQLGRSSVYFGVDDLRLWAREQRVTLAPVDEIELSHDPRLAATGCLSDRTFFRLLGFESVAALDVSPWEGADYVHDLNLPVPDELAGRFAAVFDSGALLHVFDIPAALANLHALLAVDGRVMLGMAPSSNHVDHGFYMFSPTLFHDYFEANGYRIEHELFFEFSAAWVNGRFISRPWRIFRYVPGCLDALSYGGLGAKQLGLFVVATKTAAASAGVVPLQSYFARHAADLEAERELGERAGCRTRRLLDQIAARRAGRRGLLAWKRLRSVVARRRARARLELHRRY
jgi:hypothetical protein